MKVSGLTEAVFFWANVGGFGVFKTCFLKDASAPAVKCGLPFCPKRIIFDKYFQKP